MSEHVLARKDGIGLVFALLTGSGAMCPKCGHGTRVTSKNWARCKDDDCGARVRRVPMEEVAEALRATNTETGCWIPEGCEGEGEPCLPCAARRALVQGAEARAIRKLS